VTNSKRMRLVAFIVHMRTMTFVQSFGLKTGRKETT